GEGARAEGARVVAVDTQAQGDDIGLQARDGPFGDGIQVALPGEAEAGQVPVECGGGDGRPGLAGAGGRVALADGTAVGDPSRARPQWPRQGGSREGEGRACGVCGLREPEALLVAAGRKIVAHPLAAVRERAT